MLSCSFRRLRSLVRVRSARRTEILSAKTARSSSTACRTKIQYKTPKPEQSNKAAASVNRMTSCEAIDRGLAGFENIPGATNRVDQFGLERIVHFRPQPPHHHVHNIRFGLEINVPDLLDYFSTRYDFTGKAGEMSQKKELLRCQIELHSSANGLVATRVDLKILYFQLLGLACGRSTQDRSNTRQQFGKRVRFYEIIVRPKFQAFDSIFHAISSGQEKYRRLKACSPQ